MEKENFAKRYGLLIGTGLAAWWWARRRWP